MSGEKKLIELARTRFNEISPAEEKMFNAVAGGRHVDFSSANQKENDPSQADTWGTKRTIRGECIKWLCTAREASTYISVQGIQIVGLLIEGVLDLSFSEINFPIAFFGCRFKEEIILHDAYIKTLCLWSCHTGPILGDRMEIGGSLVLTNSQFRGEASFIGATIRSQMVCKNSLFVNPNKSALTCDGIQINGDLYLNEGFKSEGEVGLRGARIDGQLICRRGTFENKDTFENMDGTAISADGIRVQGDVRMDYGFSAYGKVYLNGARIGGSFACQGGHFFGRGGRALTADRMIVEQSIYLSDGFLARGEIHFTGVILHGQLNAARGYIFGENGKAITADGLQAGQGVFLNDGFRAVGEVRFVSAVVKGAFTCRNGHFYNSVGKALVLDGSKTTGSICLDDGFLAEGEVRLTGSEISGNISFNEAEFMNPNGQAICGDSIKVGGNAFFSRGLKISGAVNLINAKINGLLAWRNIRRSDGITLDMRYSKIDTIYDDIHSWPHSGKLLLYGLMYTKFDDRSPLDAVNRLEWLRRQPSDKFRSQPYEHLAKVLFEAGQEKDAKRILIEKNRDRLNSRNMRWWQKACQFLLGLLIGYGYQPERVAIWALIFIVMSICLFQAGNKAGVMTRQQSGIYMVTGDDADNNLSPRFNAIKYSIDLFLPVIDLDHSRYWSPNENLSGEYYIIAGHSITINGKFLSWCVIAEILIGWVLTVLFLAALSGLVRK